MTDWISLGVLASSVPRDVVDDAVAVTGRGARRAGGKLPPHVMVYFVMALALFADDDYEEVAARLAEALRGWGAGGQAWDPTPGGITQARQRLGPEPMAEVFSQVAVPVAATASSTTSRGTDDARTPSEIQSVTGPPPAMPPVCAMTRDHAEPRPRQHRDPGQTKINLS